MASDQFRRCLYNEIGDYLVAKGVSASREYPWLVRCTEDIRRDCPEAKSVYKAIGATYDPSAAYPIETFPVVRVDRHNNPLNPILLTDFNYLTTSTSNADNNSCVSDMTFDSVAGQSLHNFTSSQPPVSNNPPVGQVVTHLSQHMRVPMPALQLRDRVDHMADRKRSREDSVISSVRHEPIESHDDTDIYDNKLRLTTPYTSDRMRGVGTSRMTKDMKAAPSMSWLTGFTGVSTGREGPRFITPAREPPIIIS
jgi:hypothetical protein